MKIYTRTGDKGKTSLAGGKRVSKSHLQVESYGDVDELNSFIGLISSDIDAKNDKPALIKIQTSLFHIGSYLASCNTDNSFKCLLKKSDVLFLEKEIDKSSFGLKSLKKFILPAGNQLICFCHIARTVCRRAERNVVRLNDKRKLDENVIAYLNRLSDYLFILARKFAKDHSIEEILV